MLDQVRPVRDTDSAAIIELIGGCWSAYPGCVLDVDGEEPWMRAPASAYSGKPGGRMWVVGEPVVACCGTRWVDELAVELKSLYVDATARRRGLGAALVRLVEETALADGRTRVELWSDTRFHDAHRLYERLGYAWTGRSRELHDLSETTEHEFAKQLQ